MEFDVRRKFHQTTVRQTELMLEFLRQYPFLAYGEVRKREARAKAEPLWEECARRLNKEGPQRTGKGWSKVWIDQKCRVRAKAREKGLSSLTPLEKKLIRVISKPKVKDDSRAMIEHSYQETGSLERTSFSTSIKQEDTDYEVLEEYEVLDEDTLQEPLSIPSSPATPKEQEPELEKQPDNADDKICEMEQIYTTLVKIEKTRSEAELRSAQALSSIADSFRLIAESISRLSRKFCDEDY